MVQAGQPLIVVSNTSPLTNLAAVGQFDAVQPLLHALRRQAGFYLSQPVVEHALELAGEMQDASDLDP